MGKVTLRGHIRVPAGDLAAVAAELDEHIRLTQAEAGCLIFEVVQDATDPCVFAVYEQFADRAAFDRHQARVKRSTWGRVTAGVARHYEISEADDA